MVIIIFKNYRETLWFHCTGLQSNINLVNLKAENMTYWT